MCLVTGEKNGIQAFDSIFKRIDKLLDSEFLNALLFVLFLHDNSPLNLYSPVLRPSLNLRLHHRDLRGIRE